MCGILGIYSHKPVAGELYDGLFHLQHRGQDAAGMLTYNGIFHLKKGAGYVRDVFLQEHMERLQGNWGIGHTRYPTAGSKHSVENAQPFFLHAPYGIAMAHNGDLTNYHELKKELEEKDRRHCNSSSDLEVIMHVFASALEANQPSQDFFDDICRAVESVFRRARGAYSVVGIIAGKGMIAFRDPHGIRPFVYGTRVNAEGKTEYIFSSENTMYYPLGFTRRGDIQPGEAVFIDAQGQMRHRRLRYELFTPCIFEYVYLARPDSTINNISVYRARLRMGQNLGIRWKERYPDVLPDVVIPVPFSSNTAALSMAHELGIRYSEGLYKNPFVGRTFIMPNQGERRKSVLEKLSPQETEIRGKRVLLVDDSIVRGTTSREVVKLVRNAGATAVYFASACPPVKYPDFYGIDLPTRHELVAAYKTDEEIRDSIGADLLLYQTIPGLVEAVTRKGDHRIDRPSMPYLDGWYVTGDVSQERMEILEAIKGTTNKEQRAKKILILGSGAREHAIARAIKKSKYASQLFCFGSSVNPGIKELCGEYKIGSVTDVPAIVAFAKEHNSDWVIIGPENPLEAGIVDALAEAGIPSVGPTKALAQLETSKSFTRELLTRFGIPGCPQFRYFTTMDGVREFLLSLGGNFVIKCDSLMGGKGVRVSGDHLASIDDGVAWCEELIRSGKTFLVEEKLIGKEFSLMSFSDGRTLAHMPVVQDNKRAFAGDRGPNTGGMGSISYPNHSLPFLSPEDIIAARGINEATISAVRQACGAAYRGVLYGGFMATKDGVKLIEYNARLGDPEAMNVLALLESDFVELCEAMIAGNLTQNHARFAKKATVCKYAVPFGYPDTPVKNERVDVSGVQNKDQLYYAAVDAREDGLYETGSRTVAVVGIADALTQAEAIAEEEIQRVKGPLFHREDIGKQPTPQKKLRLAVLGSTRGTDMQAIIDATHDGRLNASIDIVISNKPEAYILERARNHHIEAAILMREEDMLAVLKEKSIDLVLLIGYMRLLSPAFVHAWRNKIMNVHPSLLPAFAGGMDLSVHQAVINSGVKETGCTIHFVDEGADTGPIIVQKKCSVEPHDTADTLKERVQKLEGEAFVEAIQKFQLKLC